MFKSLEISKITGKPKQMKGFALLTQAQRTEMGRVGGKAGHAQGKAHRWTHEEAVIAGRKGALAIKKKREEEAKLKEANSGVTV